MTKSNGIPDKADTTRRGLEAGRDKLAATGLLLRAVPVSSGPCVQRQMVPTKKGISALPDSAILGAVSQELVSACYMKGDRHRWGVTVANSTG